jgi:hypothetical protein
LKTKIINQEKKFKFTSEKMNSDLNLIRKELDKERLKNEQSISKIKVETFD